MPPLPKQHGGGSLPACPPCLVLSLWMQLLVWMDRHAGKAGSYYFNIFPLTSAHSSTSLLPPSLPCLLISTLSRLILFLSVHICVFFVSIPLYHFHLRVKIINCLTIGCLVDSLNSNSGNHKSGSGLLLRGIAFESRRVEEEEEYSLASRYSLTACGRTSAARRSACCSCVVLPRRNRAACCYCLKKRGNRTSRGE